MSLKMMYITNKPEVALIAENVGVDRIFIDLEYIGKDIRQGGMDTVQSKHSLDDVKAVAEKLTKAELLVRVNPIHEKTEAYSSSKEEIDTAIENGAKVLMLPYFKTVEEVEKFITLVDGRCKAMVLLETPEAAEIADEIVKVKGLDEIFIGLNDLSLGRGKKFMFELLADGTVDSLIQKFREAGLPYGFGGLASLEGGLLPGKMVLKEHYRLDSTCVILSRSFCDVNKVRDLEKIERIFKEGIAEIRKYEEECKKSLDFEENKKSVCSLVEQIVESL